MMIVTLKSIFALCNKIKPNKKKYTFLTVKVWHICVLYIFKMFCKKKILGTCMFFWRSCTKRIVLGVLFFFVKFFLSALTWIAVSDRIFTKRIIKILNNILWYLLYTYTSEQQLNVILKRDLLICLISFDRIVFF